MLNQYKSDDYATVDAMLSYTRGIFKIWVLGSNLLDREEEIRTNASGKWSRFMRLYSGFSEAFPKSAGKK